MTDADLKALAETVMPIDAEIAYIVAACNETPKHLARIAALRAVHERIAQHQPILDDLVISEHTIRLMMDDLCNFALEALAADDKGQKD